MKAAGRSALFGTASRWSALSRGRRRQTRRREANRNASPREARQSANPNWRSTRLFRAEKSPDHQIDATIQENESRKQKRALSRVCRRQTRRREANRAASPREARQSANPNWRSTRLFRAEQSPTRPIDATIQENESRRQKRAFWNRLPLVGSVARTPPANKATRSQSQRVPARSASIRQS